MSDQTNQPDSTFVSRRYIATCLFFAILLSCLIALGWAMHHRKYKNDADDLASTNRDLTTSVASLRSELDTLKTETMDIIGILSKTNDTLSAEVAKVTASLESVTIQNLELVNQVARLDSENATSSTQDTKIISDLTAATVHLSADLDAANARIEDLLAQFKAKTDEAADLAIEVDTLVEMVARLRVLTGRTTQAITETADPNSPREDFQAR